MNLNSDFITKLKESKDLEFSLSVFDKKVWHLPESSLGMLYENITRIDFQSFYLHIQVGLFNEGLIGKEWKEDIEKAKWFLENREDLRKKGTHRYWKIFCNSLYTRIQSPYVVEYVHMFYQDLIEKYGELIIYNNTDTLYLNIDKRTFQTRESITELKDFEYDVKFINYFYIEKVEKYIQQDEFGELKAKGFKDENKKQILLNMIKKNIRMRKLNKLGI